MQITKYKLQIASGLWLGLTFIIAAPVFAQGSEPGQPAELVNLLPAALILLLPLGLLLLISSAMPETQAPAMAVSLFTAWAAAALAYFGLGFAFQFGGVAQVSPNPDLRALYWEWYPLDQSVDFEAARLWGAVALRGWALAGEAATPGAMALCLSHLALVGVTAMIPVSVLPLRGRGIIALAVGLAAGALLYPVPGNWLWGGGWLSNLGISLGMGHGLVDLGGASIVFLGGSMAALTALAVWRANRLPDTPPKPVEGLAMIDGAEYRLTVYEEEVEVSDEEVLSVTPMPSAYLPILSLLGAGLLLLGWWELAAGWHVPTATDFYPAQAAVSGLLAALGSALMAAGYSWFTTRQVNPLMMARGAAAGLIVAAAGAPFMPVWITLLAGLLMGLFLPSLIYLFNQGLHLADETGAVATYGVSALVSLLLVAFFADGRAGQGWNGVGLADYQGVAGQGVSGLLVASGLASDWPGQLQAQLLGIGAVTLWTFLIGFLLFQTIVVVAKSWMRTGLELAAPVETERRGDEEE